MRAALFGPSGNPESFYAEGHKSSLDMPEWLANLLPQANSAIIAA